MANDTNLNFDFPITVYGALTKISATSSLARARIFYKGINRNGTYISDEFAEKLISTIAFAPVKGIYDYAADDPDFTDHGVSPSLGRVYGVVPKEYNLRWEDHEDSDGITRTYATVDVILWTALYEEANDIVGKSLSMEIYPKSIVGQWAIKEGMKVFMFEEGEFFGLQVLGDQYEPCFEGAGYYSLYSAFLDLYKQLDNYSHSSTKGGLTQMPKVMNFKLSDREKYDLLWQALNPNYSESGNWEIEMGINDIFDDYALCYNYEEHQFYRVFFTKSDEGIEVTSKEARFFLDLSEAEYNALMNLRGESGTTTYEEISTKLATLETNFATTQQNYTTLQEEYDTFKANLPTPEPPVDTTVYTARITELEGQVTDLTTENEGLKTYKLQIEDAARLAVIEKYTALLPEDVMVKYTAEDAYKAFSVDELNSKLAVDYVNTQVIPATFTHNQAPAGAVPKNDIPESGLPALLNKHKQNNTQNS